MRNAALALAFALAAGCGGGSHDDAADETVAAIRELATILEGVEDEADAKSAVPKLEKLAERLDKVVKDLDKLGEPSADESKRLDEKMRKALEGVDERMDAAMSKLGDMGSAAAPLQAPVLQVMAKLMAIRGGLGG